MKNPFPAVATGWSAQLQILNLHYGRSTGPP